MIIMGSRRRFIVYKLRLHYIYLKVRMTILLVTPSVAV